MQKIVLRTKLMIIVSILLSFTFQPTNCQVTLQGDHSLRITVVCPSGGCTLMPNHNNQTPTLLPATTIYIPQNALGLVSTNPLTITDYFTGTFIITNGTDGVNGANGLDGRDGINGTDGLDGTNGVNGANGLDGTDGVNGIDGLDGKDGINGTDGLDGRDGINGTDGFPGRDCELNLTLFYITIGCAVSSIMSLAIVIYLCLTRDKKYTSEVQSQPKMRQPAKKRRKWVNEKTEAIESIVFDI